MSNGKLIAQLRELAQREGDISVQAAIQLILTAMSETTENLQNVAVDLRILDAKVRSSLTDLGDCLDDNSRCTSELEARLKDIQDERENLLSEIRSLKGSMDPVLRRIDDLTSTVNEKILKNPLVKIGLIYMEYPLAIRIIFILTVLLLNVWLVNGAPDMANFILELLARAAGLDHLPTVVPTGVP